MQKHIIAALAIVVFGAVVMVQPAQAWWCWSDGHHWKCQAGVGPAPSWRHRHPERPWYPF